MTEKELLSDELETEVCRSARKTSTFEKVIQQDRSICDHCFRQVYDKDPNWIPDSAKESVKRMTTDTRYDGRHEDTEMIPDTRQYHTTSGETRSCKCGSVDFKPYNRPLGKGIFMEYAENLSQRLYEEGYKHDEDEFLHICRELKSEDEMKDDMMYNEATQELVG